MIKYDVEIIWNINDFTLRSIINSIDSKKKKYNMLLCSNWWGWEVSFWIYDYIKTNKVKVNISIFGRPTPVELDFLQVELEK